jgi:hypothetical protein
MMNFEVAWRFEPREKSITRKIVFTNESVGTLNEMQMPQMLSDDPYSHPIPVNAMCEPELAGTCPIPSHPIPS